MPISMRKAAIITVSILVGLVLIAAIIPLFIDAERFKPAILTAAEEALGREVRIDGELSVGLLPRPKLAAEKLVIANADGFDAPALARIERLDVEVALWPLLTGRVEVARLVLRSPDIALERKLDGSVNWQLGGESESSQSDGDFALNNLRITNGHVSYLDHAGGAIRELSGIDARLSLGSLKGPIEAEVVLTLDGVALSSEVEIEEFGSGLAALTASGRLGDSLAQWSYEGEAALSEGAFSTSGALKVKSANIRRLAGALSREESTLPDRALDISLNAVLNDEKLTLSDIAFALGESRANGALTILLGEMPMIDGRLAFSRLRLEDISAASDGDAPLVGPIPLTLPRDVAAEITLTIAELSGAPLPVHDVNAVMRLDGGVLQLGEGRLRLAERDQLALSGWLASKDGFAQAGGEIRFASGNLRGLLKAMSDASDGLPDNALNSISLDAKLALNGDALRLYDLALTLDDSRVAGEVTYGMRQRPAYTAKLRVDQLDLARYLPASKSDAPLDLSPLKDFDANLKLDVARLANAAQNYGAAAFELSLLQGVMNINNAALGNAGEARVAVSGRLRDFGAATRFDLTLKAEAQSLENFSRFTGEALPETLRETGSVTLSGSLAGSQESVALDLAGQIGAMRLGINGKLDKLASAAQRYDLNLDIQHESLPALLQQFDLADWPTTAAAQPLKFAAKLTGGADDIVAAGQATLPSGSFSLLLDRDARQTPHKIKLRVTSKSKQAAVFLRELGIDYQPVQATIGEMDVAIVLEGDGDSFQFTELGGRFGPADLKGSGSLRMGKGDAPAQVTLALSSTSLPFDDILPPPETGADEAAAGGDRWSEEPLAVDWLKSIDGLITLTAKAMRLRGYDFTDVSLRADSNGPMLNITELSGRMFGGTADIKAQLDATATPKFTLDYSLVDVPLAQTLNAMAAIQPATGTLSFQGRYAGSGVSPKAIVGALTGTGQFTAKDGLINRVDFVRLNERLGQLSNIEDFVTLMGGALGKGQTAYRHMGFTLAANKGVLTSREFTSDIDGALVNFTMNANLPAWTIDARAGLQLKDHPNAPPLGISVRGDFATPEIKYETEALKKWLATRLGAAVLRGVVGGEKMDLGDLLGVGKKPPTEPQQAPAESEPQPAPPPEQKKPEEQLRDLLLDRLRKKPEPAPAPQEQQPPPRL